MVPHLTTLLTGPLRELERRVLDRRPEIERWFRSRFAEHPMPFYSLVDLRNSGFNLAPVDTNLFPGGLYWVQTARGKNENLNSSRVEFRPLAFEMDCHSPACAGAPKDPPNRFHTYGVVSRLANLAAAIEVVEMAAGADEPAAIALSA